MLYSEPDVLLSDSPAEDEIRLLDDTQDFSEIREERKLLLRLNKQIQLLERDREDIKQIIQHSFSISGLLLTVSIGALYFSYSTTTSIHPPLLTKISLFISAIGLSTGILINIYALRLHPQMPVEEEELLIALKNVYAREGRIVGYAYWILLISVVLIIFGLGDFALDRAGITLVDNNFMILCNSSGCIISDTIISLNNVKLLENDILKNASCSAYGVFNNFWHLRTLGTMYLLSELFNFIINKLMY